MSTTKTCPNCGAALPLSAPEGLCPRCLARRGLDEALSGSATQLDAENSLAGPKPALGRIHYLGDYELIEEIARGGMGVVYKARQVSLNRTVAVKLMLFGEFASEEFVRRFRAEAEAVASLQHPNIVAIHEIGEHEGQHYFSMDYVAGQNLAERARDNPLPPEVSADYLQTIAEAVHYAHERGILHRDLKPSNVLIDDLDRPRITDFGLAKRLRQDANLTTTGQVLGSPNFMPPEQASPDRGPVGPASDVYSLGAILYHLLTGRPPFLAGSAEETLNRLLHTEPVAPRLLNPAVPRDLETICLKCLEKEPHRRYTKAQALAEDVGRWRRHEPIHARPSTQWDRIVKWAARRPALATMAAALALSVGLGVSAVLWSWRGAVVARREASRLAGAERRAHELADESAALVQVQMADQLFSVGDPSKAWAYLARALRQAPGNETVAGQVFERLARRSPIIPISKAFRHEVAICFAQFGPYGQQRVVTASWDGSARVWETATGRPVTPPLKHAGPVRSARFSPDGLLVATASDDGTARIWDSVSGQPVTPPLEHPQGVRYVHFSPEGERVLTGTVAWDGSFVRLWDARTGQPLTAPIPNESCLLFSPFSPDGRRFVTASGANSAVIRDASTGNPMVGPLRHEAGIRAVEFSPDGTRVVTASGDGTARLWDAATGQPLAQPLNTFRSVLQARFSPDCRQIVTLCNDSTLQIWDGETGRALSGPIGHQEPPPPAAGAHVESIAVPLDHLADHSSVQFSPDGERLLMVLDGRAALLEYNAGRIQTTWILDDAISSAEFALDNQRVLTASWRGYASVWGIRRVSDTNVWTAVEQLQPLGPDNGGPRGGVFAPVPAWMPGLLEALAGQKLDDSGSLQAVPLANVEPLRQQSATTPAVGVWARWAAWAFSPGDADRLPPATRSRGAATQGAEMYAHYCAVCHGPEGRGIPGVFPPLAGSEWVTAPAPDRLIRMQLDGLQGPITVKGEPYGALTDLPRRDLLNNQELATLLTFVRGNTNWGNAASPVTAAAVKVIREATATRGSPWTTAELLEIPVGGPDPVPPTEGSRNQPSPSSVPRTEENPYE